MNNKKQNLNNKNNISQFNTNDKSKDEILESLYKNETNNNNINMNNNENNNNAISKEKNSSLKNKTGASKKNTNLKTNNDLKEPKQNHNTDQENLNSQPIIESVNLNELELKITNTSTNSELVNEKGSTIVSFLMQDDGQVFISFLGDYNKQKLNNLKHISNKYFKTLKKKLFSNKNNTQQPK